MMSKTMQASSNRLAKYKVLATAGQLQNWVVVQHEEGTQYVFRNAFMVADQTDLNYVWVLTEHHGSHIFAVDELSGAWQLEQVKELAHDAVDIRTVCEARPKRKHKGVKVVKEPDEGPAMERCCFCDSPTKYWYYPPGSRKKKINCNEVACCQACASMHDVKDMPSKEAWCADQRAKHKLLWER